MLGAINNILSLELVDLRKTQNLHNGIPTIMISFIPLACLFGLALGSPVTTRQQACNGNTDFCDRKYSNVSWIGSHDSAFVGSIIDPRVNQEVSVTKQLDAGIRFLQAQTHSANDGATLEMCHTTCLEFDAGSLETYLSTVKTWLDGNANEVLTMLLVNGDGVDVSMFDTVFASTGLKDYAFVPSTGTDQLAIANWPTYAELISAGTRIVIFLDAKADESSVPYILDEVSKGYGATQCLSTLTQLQFTYFFETPYDTTAPSFPECTLDRPAGGSPDSRMYIVNHFLDKSIFSVLVPDDAADYTTNAATGSGSIGAQADLCAGIYGRMPNFVLVDMFSRGDVFAAQAALNGVS